MHPAVWLISFACREICKGNFHFKKIHYSLLPNKDGIITFCTRLHQLSKSHSSLQKKPYGKKTKQYSTMWQFPTTQPKETGVGSDFISSTTTVFLWPILDDFYEPFKRFAKHGIKLKLLVQSDHAYMVLMESNKETCCNSSLWPFKIITNVNAPQKENELTPWDTKGLLPVWHEINRS